MTLSPDIREFVRRRARFACEYCGVTETNVGSELTVDHFQPKTKGGTDAPDNLLYCCFRCNLYKADYWPEEPEDLPLWNPRRETAAQHFIEKEDGTFYPVTPVGSWTVQQLRLNREQLVAHRLEKKRQIEAVLALAQFGERVRLNEQFQAQALVMIEEQQMIIKAQNDLLLSLLR